MFGILKKKISDFIQKITLKEQENQKELSKEESRLPPVSSTPLPSSSTEKSSFSTAQKQTDSLDSVKPSSLDILEPAPMPPEKSMPTSPKVERKLEPKLSLVSKVKGFLVNEVEIQEHEIAPLLDELHWAMLESDVSLDTADHMVQQLKTQLIGQKIAKNQLQEEVRQRVRQVLRQTLTASRWSLLEYLPSHEKPIKILFLGPNGSGKTTTIAKLAYYLRQQGFSCVMAAADTFRAAAIEQLLHHGQRLGFKVITRQYAADPSAVAFDAISYAKAHNIGVVLIDTAGRQETNYNLLKEMEKINRVIKPDLKLFVGEAIAGHVIVEQAKAFHAALRLDGIILTKLDCDAKGGTSFSLVHEVGVPLLFIGSGQRYEDFQPFNAEWIVDNVLAE